MKIDGNSANFPIKPNDSGQNNKNNANIKFDFEKHLKEAIERMQNATEIRENNGKGDDNKLRDELTNSKFTGLLGQNNITGHNRSASNQYGLPNGSGVSSLTANSIAISGLPQQRTGHNLNYVGEYIQNQSKESKGDGGENQKSSIEKSTDGISETRFSTSTTEGSNPRKELSEKHTERTNKDVDTRQHQSFGTKSLEPTK